MTQVRNWFNQLDQLIHPQVKMALMGLGVLALSATAWFGYQWYYVQQIKNSQKIVADCLEEYNKTIDSEQPLWNEVVMMNELGLQQSTKVLHPYFLVMEAQALARQGEVHEALPLMQQAINGLASDSPYYTYFKTTHALMQLDAQDVGVLEHGLDQLRILADDQKNIYRDIALYHIGAYYWSQDDVAQAKTFWQELVDLKNTVFADSSWAGLAEQKMQMIG